MPAERAVLTLAAGNPIYWQMAVNLARSFLWWHKQTDIRLCIVTDLPDELPGDLSRVELIRVAPEKIGKGFSAKLHLDELSLAKQTLLIDADCLVVGSLESVFDRFRGGLYRLWEAALPAGEWFGDVTTICAHFQVASLPKFNGGISYLKSRRNCPGRLYQGT